VRRRRLIGRLSDKKNQDQGKKKRSQAEGLASYERGALYWLKRNGNWGRKTETEEKGQQDTGEKGRKVGGPTGAMKKSGDKRGNLGEGSGVYLFTSGGKRVPRRFHNKNTDQLYGGKQLSRMREWQLCQN